MSDSSGHFIDVNEAKILSKNINKNQKLIIGWAGDVKIGNVLTSFCPPKIKNTQYDKYIQTGSNPFTCNFLRSCDNSLSFMLIPFVI